MVTKNFDQFSHFFGQKTSLKNSHMDAWKKRVDKKNSVVGMENVLKMESHVYRASRIT